MPTASNGFHVILRYPEHDTRRCLAWTVPHTMRPVLIDVVGVDVNEPLTAQLGREIALAIPAVLPSAGVIVPACKGWWSGPCFALDRPGVEKVLIVVGPRARRGAMTPSALDEHSYDAVFPVVPPGGRAIDLPPSMRHAHAIGYSNHAALELLGSTSIPGEGPRVFISYAREGSSRLAEQLFEALTKARVRTFVDRFGIEPGNDFRDRIHEALEHMACILVLESPEQSRSEWCQLELTYAAAMRMGLLAIHVPRAPRSTLIPEDRRFHVKGKHLKGSPRRQHEIADAAVLEDLAEWVRTYSSRALIERTERLQSAMLDALGLAGVMQVRVEPDGTVVGRGRSSAHAIRVRPVPATLADFHGVSRHGSSHVRHVVAPGRHTRASRAASMAWLSSVSGIGHRDETEMQELAYEVAP